MPLRIEQARDHDAVGAIHRVAFGDHGDTVARLVDALRRDDPDGLSLVSEDAGEVVGHVMVTRARLDAPRRLVDVRSLSPLGVLPHRQQQGIGSELVRAAVTHLDELGVPLVFLEGDPNFYSRLGFVRAIDLGFRKPSLRVTDGGFQVIRLSAYEPWMTGTYVYSNTFWDYDCVGLREPEPAEGP